jgi:hypothetical protein
MLNVNASALQSKNTSSLAIEDTAVADDDFGVKSLCHNTLQFQ